VGPYHITEAPAVREKYKQASSELLEMLGQTVYPALQEDAANETSRYPIDYDIGGWYTFRIETPGGGLHFLLYQAIEELRRVLIFDLVTVREP
jgi:hypothetical protein